MTELERLWRIVTDGVYDAVHVLPPEVAEVVWSPAGVIFAVLAAAAVAVFAGDIAQAVVPGRNAALKRIYGTAIAAGLVTVPEVPKRSVAVGGTHSAAVAREAWKQQRRDQREADRMHRTQTVTVRRWEAGQPADTTVRFPETVESHPDARPRRAFEAQYREAFGDVEFVWHPGRVDIVPLAALPDTVAATEETFDLPARRMPVGVGHHGPIVWDLDTKPHALIGGASGNGKTVLMRLLLIAMVRRGAHIVALDPKRVEFAWLRGFPDVDVVVSDNDRPNEPMADALADAVTEMRRRYARMEQAGVTDMARFDSPDPPLFVVVDEARDLLDKRGATDRETRERCGAHIDHLARMGRAAHVHVILATQYPYADFLPGGTRGNLEAAFALGHLRPEQSAVILGNAAAADIPPDAPKGRGVARLGRYEPMQVAYVDPSQIGRFVPDRPAPDVPAATVTFPDDADTDEIVWPPQPEPDPEPDRPSQPPAGVVAGRRNVRPGR